MGEALKHIYSMLRELWVSLLWKNKNVASHSPSLGKKIRGSVDSP